LNRTVLETAYICFWDTSDLQGEHLKLLIPR
jgi:hypothetical protein